MKFSVFNTDGEARTGIPEIRVKKWDGLLF